MIPKIKLENLEISRLVCGTNPFMGISHFTRAKDLFFREYFDTPAKIAEIMRYMLEEFGVNACISSPRDEMYAAIQIVEKETGQKYYWICTPSRRLTAKSVDANTQNQVQWCADHGVSVCMPHRDYTDHNITEEGTIRGYPEIAAVIRDKGMIPGLSTHYHETISICDQQNYDASLITQPLNTVNFMANLEVNELVQKIQHTKRQILAIKPLAAGRVLPEVGLTYCLNVIKPNDFVAIGFGSIHEADYDCQLVEQIFAKSGPL